MTKFILLAARRSGTTLLIDCLNSHPQVNCAKREFGLEKKIENPTPDHQAGEFYLYRMENLSRQVAYYAHRKGLINRFLRDQVFGSDDQNFAAGFRLIYEMASKYPQIASWAGKNDVKILHLIRQNILKTFVSTVTAELHKMHHPRAGAKIKTVKVHLDPEATLREMEKRSKQIEHNRSLFGSFAYQEIIYEDFVTNRSLKSQEILKFIGVDSSIELVTDLVKINPSMLCDVIENYDEVCQVLQGTPYEKHLD